MCLWDSRSKHEQWIKKKWPVREDITFGSKNIGNPPIIDRGKIILPPLHSKLGLMKQFVKALNHNGHCFTYITQKMHDLSMKKLKANIFDGPKIKQLINDPYFIGVVNEFESKAWTSFVLVGNHRVPNYK